MDNKTKEPTIYFDRVPEYVKDYLAQATYNAVVAFLRKPGGKEFLEAKMAEKKSTCGTNSQN